MQYLENMNFNIREQLRLVRESGRKPKYLILGKYEQKMLIPELMIHASKERVKMYRVPETDNSQVHVNTEQFYVYLYNYKINGQGLWVFPVDAPFHLEVTDNIARWLSPVNRYHPVIPGDPSNPKVHIRYK